MEKVAEPPLSESENLRVCTRDPEKAEVHEELKFVAMDSCIMKLERSKSLP